VDVRSGRVVGVEALLRWNAPDGLVPPVQFVPIAEDTGLIVPIGAWVVREACAQVARWRDAGIDPVRVAVNLSPRQLQGHDIVATVRDALDATGIDPDLLELEITETLAMRNPDASRRAMEQLKDLGVHVALDDFGTGHSALAYLRRFPFDRVKIDRSFLQSIAEDPAERAIVSAIIALAHAVDLEVVAEGVEDAAQYAILAEDGCDVAQGFGLSRPVPEPQVRELLLHERRLGRRLARPRLRVASA
jgi:EAL domain-containing protein (putative c-di-GMP-specific phosphodiesterase class I)